jgi:hypothetical protein
VRNIVLDAPIHPVEGGSANDYDYTAGDPINNYDLDGTRCLTGVARRVEEQRYNAKTGETETKTREICRSVSRGAKRTARAIADDPGKYFTQCLRGIATGAVTGVYVGGLAGAAGNGARECLSNVVAQALIDGGVDKEFVAWANGVSTAYSGAKNFAVGTTQIVEFRGPFYP